MATLRRELWIRGVVQGVGFRPWAARHARSLGLAGSVRNTADGVRVALEGTPQAVQAWLDALRAEPPPGARIESVARRTAAPEGATDFRIETSLAAEAGPRTRIPPDVAVCAPCRDELFDPNDRRHRYPFTHCARCGPRASVLRDLPYDRERTTLAGFPPCTACRREYADPEDRRHHAQTVACPACGPRVAALDPSTGRVLPGDPIERTAAALGDGAIVAVKGYGGFHLVADATRDDAVERLRQRKGRPVKPFAVLVPDLATAHALAALEPTDQALLAGPERAVVIAPRRCAATARPGLAGGVAPRTRDLGLILPVAPVHWLLLFGPGDAPGRDPARFPALVFTSANRSEAPTLWDDAEARRGLVGLADLVLTHDRAVARPNDDPVVRSAPERPIAVRLSRATAPVTLALPEALTPAPTLLALGGDLKCAPALLINGRVHLAEHVGDLSDADAADALERRVADLVRLLGAKPEAIAHDLHPAYLGTQLASTLGPPTLPVQHHHAHAAAVLLEHGITGPALALVLDGAGFGNDATFWGGELLRVELASFERLAHLETVPLPGGDAAAREPWRMAAVWLARAFPEGAPRLPWHARRDPAVLARLERVAARGIASPPSSSCGRLFDAVASLLDQADRVTHEGEAALALESLAEAARGEAGDGQARRSRTAGVIPAADLVRAVVEERVRGEEVSRVARRFHLRLAGRLAAAAADAARWVGLRQVIVTGGCLQNRLLAAALRQRLRSAGLEPLEPRRLPPNDGALAAGQAVVAAARLLDA